MFLSDFLKLKCGREAWKSYESFPQADAAKAYVYLVSQLQADKEGTEDIEADNHSAIAGFGATVSTLK